MEYMVLAAAVVGLGLAAVTSVRDGVGTLGRDSGDSLTHATVVPTSSGTGGGGTGTGGGGGGTPDISYPTGSLTYTLRHYDQNTFDSLQTWVAADFRDSDVLQEYSFQVDLLMQDLSDTAMARETLDWIYVMAYEITRRGLSYPSNSLTFDQVIATYDAALSPMTDPTTRGPRTPPPRS